MLSFLVRCLFVVCCLASAGTYGRAQPAKQDEKKPAKQEEVKKAEPISIDDLKAKLKGHEEEILKIRQVMLKAIETEEKAVAEAIKKAKDAGKAGQPAAFAEMGKLQSQKAKLMQMRMDIELRIRVGQTVPVKPALPLDLQLGLVTVPANATLRAQLGLAKDQGLVIERVTADSPAAKAGLKAHDVLVQVQDKQVSSDTFAFRKMLGNLKTGEAFDVVVVRNGKQETIKGLVVPAPK